MACLASLNGGDNNHRESGKPQADVFVLTSSEFQRISLLLKNASHYTNEMLLLSLEVDSVVDYNAFFLGSRGAKSGRVDDSNSSRIIQSRRFLYRRLKKGSGGNTLGLS